MLAPLNQEGLIMHCGFHPVMLFVYLCHYREYISQSCYSWVTFFPTNETGSVNVNITYSSVNAIIISEFRYCCNV